MAAVELLPCPFCGRSAKVVSWWSVTEECGAAVAACTKESYVNGPECASILVMRADEKTAKEDAITIWNRRAFGKEVRLEGDTLYFEGLGTFERVKDEY
jgi:hypothetical protein